LTSGWRALYSSASFSAKGWKAVEPARVTEVEREHDDRSRAARQSPARRAAGILARIAALEADSRRCIGFSYTEKPPE
jgi:hypothetical protein